MGRKLKLIDGDGVNAYHWELVFDDIVLNQHREASKPKEDRYSVDSYPNRFGRPCEIRLVPHKKTIQEVVVNIPDGAIPVYFRVMGASSTGASGCAAFAIGYKQHGRRVLKMVEAGTGQVTDVVDSQV